MSAIAPLVFVVSAIGVLVLGVAVVLLAGKYSRARGYRAQVAMCTASRDGVFTHYEEMIEVADRVSGRKKAVDANQQAAINYGGRQDWQPERGVEWERQAVPQKHDLAVRDSNGEVAYDVTDRWPRKGKLVRR